MTRHEPIAKSECLAAEQLRRRQFKKAETTLRELAEQESALGHAGLAWLRQNKFANLSDEMSAEERFIIAANKGYEPAFYYLGKLYLSEGEHECAVNALQKGALAGDIPSKYLLGSILVNNSSLSDIEKGKKYLVEAANTGHIFAERRLAGIYFRSDKSGFRIPAYFYRVIKIIYKALFVAWHNPDDDVFRA
jgi:TPR repeat protein